YCAASKYHAAGYDKDNNAIKIKFLEKSIELNPNEATFYYMKGLWMSQELQIEKIMGSIEKYEEVERNTEILANMKKASSLSPEWDAPQDFMS
ncbi:hypothetical protein P4640_27540, partial [Priestia aryabhattai]|uniref:hypothetical protein n=1 Tax=Priestia aryabhattai TaxID=412384 RepID=UPI002E1ED237|nr:hypothetical protein [Priestia aryabhattai]